MRLQSVLVENKNVVKETRCNGSDESRPGDGYPPNFLENRSGYIDITVRNSLQPVV